MATEIDSRTLAMCDGMAFNYARTLPAHVDYDEIRAVARLGLAVAASRHVQRGTIPFSAYAAVVIRGHMTDHVRRMMRAPRTYPLWDGAEHDPILADPAPGALAQLVAADDVAEMLELLSLLPPKYQSALRGVYLEGRKQGDVARDLGVAQSTVCKRVEAALAMMRRLMALPAA